MKKNTRSRFLVLGKVRKPHGLKGDLSIVSYAESPLIFKRLRRIFLKPEHSSPLQFEIIKYREHGKYILLRLRNILNRDEAEAWRGADVLALRRDIPKEEGDIFFADIIGCKVFLPNGTVVGRVKEVKRYPQEIWEIEDDNGNEILFPARDEFVEKLDVEQREIIIIPPPGLLEIYGFSPSPTSLLPEK